jgi:hypothetical protein
MDTDDLSIPTYRGILLEAEKFNHDLTLQFGVLASECQDDDDYLNKAEALIQKWLTADDLFYEMDYIFFGATVSENEFKKTLQRILSNSAEIRKTPMKDREYEDW